MYTPLFGCLRVFRAANRLSLGLSRTSRFGLFAVVWVVQGRSECLVVRGCVKVVLGRVAM